MVGERLGARGLGRPWDRGAWLGVGGRAFLAREKVFLWVLCTLRAR